MTFTGKRSKEASKIEKKKNSCELISDAYQTYYMRKWLYMLLVSHLHVTKGISQNYFLLSLHVLLLTVFTFS